jgi:hypothetical protein
MCSLLLSNSKMTYGNKNPGGDFEALAELLKRVHYPHNREVYRYKNDDPIAMEVNTVLLTRGPCIEATEWEADCVDDMIKIK